MASYEDIRAYCDTSELLLGAVRSAAQVPIVTGFTLDIDPYWCRLYDEENDLIDREFDRELWNDRYQYSYRYLDQEGPGLSQTFQGFRRRDLHKPAKHWTEWTEGVRKNNPGRGERLPVVLTVVHRPLRARRSEDVEDDTSLLQRLIRQMREVGVLVRIEERPRARLAVASGDEITIPPSTSGTLGGVLCHSSGVSYGVTCSHVAQKHDVINDSGGNRIGVCIADTPRFPLAGPRVCDPINLVSPSPIPSNGPEINMLDCALIKLAANVTRPTITGVAQALSPGQSIVLDGAVTGKTWYWLGSLCLSYGFYGAGQNFCFRDAIEIIPQPRGILGRATVPTQGDSGGWILTDDQPPEWAGLFFGEDGKRGFAVRATWVHGWAEGITGVGLTP